jgi:small-conductance mechanosensitive channel
VRLDTGEEGTLNDIGWRNTTMTTGQNNLVVIPNVKIASAKVTNFNLPELVTSISVPVIVGYDSDLEKVEKVSIAVAKEILNEIPGGVKTYEPFVRYEAFVLNGISFSVYLSSDQYSDQFLIKHEFIKRLSLRFKKENIEIPYPTRTVYVKNQS